MKEWHCNVCGKTTTSDTPNDDAAPEHIAHRGQDIGNCSGMMEIIVKVKKHEKKIEKLVWRGWHADKRYSGWWNRLRYWIRFD